MWREIDVSNLMDLISQIDDLELDQEIAEATRRLAILRTLKRTLTEKAAPKERKPRLADDPRSAASIPEEIAHRVAAKAIAVLRKRQPISFHELRAIVGGCSPGQLSAALACDWFTKEGTQWSLSAAGEKAIRDQTLKQGA